MMAGQSRRSASLRISGVLLVALALSACGFHLRGASSATLPPALSGLQVAMPGLLVDPPLLVEVRNALRADDVDLGGRGPTLTLLGEDFIVEVLAIDTTGRVSEYLLNYALRYRLDDTSGQPLIAPTGIKLQREQSFDRLNVLATEKEQSFLKESMRQQAIAQLLRQLAHWQPAAPAHAP
jgi:LPS-assembly lipoprotein